MVRVDGLAGRSQIRKTVRPRPAAHNAPARLRHEYAMLRMLEANAVARVPRPLGFEEVEAQPTLVMSDAGPRNLGERLHHRGLPTELFLDMAIQLAETVSVVHRHRVIHRDINPSNIVVGADGRTLTLVDFGLATHVVAVPHLVAAGELAGTLPYLAPEQTGRVERPLDHRADLYSLGATLYEMLTGSPPFQCEDPAELVHAHLAWTPVPPTARNPAVPEVLSGIVLRLLAKMPAQRYQSGEALVADLREAQRQWEGGRTIAPFELGRFDVAQELFAPAHLQGRAPELAELEAAVRRVAAGACELVVLSGPAGVGKSRLGQALASIDLGAGHLLAGKAHPLHGNVPYEPFAELLRGFLREVLREPPHVVDGWRRRLGRAVDTGAGVIAELLPELRSLLGETPAPPAVGALANENRVRLALQSLVQGLSESGEPLVLFLDDLQWADALSLSLLERLVSAPDAHHLLVVAAIRDDDIAEGRALDAMLENVRAAGRVVRTLALAPLGAEAVNGLCAEVLRSPPDRTRPLADLVLRKTAGNPFFAERFLRLLHRSGLLVLDEQRGGWSWDLAGAEELAVTDNVVDLMVGAISKLSGDTAALLPIAACMRARIDLGLLAAVVGESPGETARRLWAALRDGLLVPERAEVVEGAPADEPPEAAASYRFAHDRVRQAAYGLLDERARKRTHLAIGRRLLAARPAMATDEDLFDVVDQLDRGADLMDDDDERLRLAELDLRAAQRARTSGSLGQALAYARQGMAVLPPGSRQTRRALWLGLYREAADCAFCRGDYAAGEAFFAGALEHAESPLEKGELYALRVTAESMHNASQAAVQWGCEGLRLLGAPLPEDLGPGAVAGAVAAAREKLRGQTLERLADLPPMRDARALAEIELLNRMTTNTQLGGQAVYSLVISRMVTLSLEKGYASATPSGFINFAALLRTLDEEDATADALARAGLELAGRLRDATTDAWVFTAYPILHSHWHQPLRANLPLIRRAVKAALESGEFLMLGWAFGSLVSHLFHSGAELARVESECAAAERVLLKTGQRPLLSVMRPYRRTIWRLQTPRREQQRIPDEHPVATGQLRGEALFLDHPMRLVAPCVLRERPELERLFRGKRELVQFGQGLAPTTAATWFMFYKAITAAVLHDGADPEEQALLHDVLADGQRALSRWARRCPAAFQHRADLVAAELARIEGRLAEALPLYDRSIEGARREHAPHDEAMAYELAGRCRLAAALTQTAQGYLQEARAVFARWGAAAKVEALDEEFPDLAAGPSAVAGPLAGHTTGDEGGVAALDLQSLLKATETLSSEVVPDRLLEKLIAVCLEVAGARRGALVLEQQGRLEVRAVGAVSEPVRLEPTALGSSMRVPRTLLEHTFARGEPVSLGDAARQGPFTADPYFAANGVKSALAVPIRHHARAVGVLYLEHDLATHAFPPERVRVLGLLSSQIAISLENSRLFEDLKIEVRERTRAEQAVRFIAGASAALAESLDYRTTLAEVARLAVPFLGDWCTVDVLEPDGKLAPVAAVHVDPARQALLEELRTAFPVVEEARLPSLEALRTRRPVLIAEVDEQRVLAAISDPRHLELVRAIGARSVLAVPLVARGRALGAITVAHATSGRRYQSGDVAVVDELARRAAVALDNARLYQEAQVAVRVRDEFLTVASHELNTPVAALRLSVPVRGGDVPLPPETVGKMLAIVDRQTERLGNVIAEVLDVARFQAGAQPMRLEPVDLAALAQELVARLESARAQARCPLSLRAPAPVVGRWDRAAVERVLANLLSNAMKFGAGKPIEVEVEAHGPSARLKVRDHGIGIEPAQLPRIFDRFARGVSADHYGGLGLGLYIARVIVMNLGGAIEVDSTPGQGATFTVDLPRGEEG